LLGGSLPKASTLALIGAPGAGTSTTCANFIASALTKGGKVLFALFDYHPAIARKYFESIGFDIKPYLDNGKLIIIDGYDMTYKKMGIARSYEIDNLRPISSEEIINTFENEILDKYHLRARAPISYVMDSFTALSPLIDVRSAYHLAMEICNRVRRIGASALIVAHEGVLEGNFVQALIRSVDGIIRLKMLWQKTGLVRRIHIEKQPSAATQRVSAECEITNQGIRVKEDDAPKNIEKTNNLHDITTTILEKGDLLQSPERRVSTGVQELDTMLEGGFPKGTFICLKGEVGTGTSTFCTQFAWSRLQADGRVAYYCADEPPEIVNRRFKSFGWNLEPYLESNRMALIDAFSFLTRDLRGADRESTNINARRHVLTAFMREEREVVRNLFGKTSLAVIVDSFTALAPYLDLKSSYVLARMVADSARRRDETFLAVVRSSVVEANLFYACLGTTDALIEMKNLWLRRKLLRRMRIGKMAFTSTPPRPIEYEITGEGIKLVSPDQS
jgi:KaiC/GvpD/RAD55 family RecA-like ATPase